MKTLLKIILMAIAIDCVSAQAEPIYEWKVTLKVVEITGQAVGGAETWVNYLDKPVCGFYRYQRYFVASHLDHSVQLAFQAQKTGYYTFGMQYQWVL